MKNNKTRKNLKYKINDYILKKSDICCEEDLDRPVVIEKIFKNYEKLPNFLVKRMIIYHILLMIFQSSSDIK